MKHRYLLLMTISSILHTPANIHALSPAERAIEEQTIARQGAEVRIIRKDAVEVFCALDATLDKDPAAAKEKADDIALRPSGLSAANTVAEFTAKITRTGPGPTGVTAKVTPTNPDAVKVLVGLLASLGIHTRDIMGDSGTGYLSPEELAALIPGIDVEAYARDGKRVESIWDWARVETLSLMETKPAVFKPSATRVKELLEGDRKFATAYLNARYPRTPDKVKKEWLDLLIPEFDGDESCPKKGAFMSSIFFVQLLDSKAEERNMFIRDVIGAMLPPPGADKFLFPDGRESAVDLNYYVLKMVYKDIVDSRHALGLRR
jgi:hypothetical protein